MFAALLAVAVGRALFSAFGAGSTPSFITEPERHTGEITVHELSIEGRSYGNGESSPTEGKLEQLTGPLYIEAGPDGNLFCVDEGEDELIKEFSPSGRLLNTFSDYGRQEIRSVSDLLIERETLWVADLLGSAIHRLDRATGRWTKIDLPFDPYRLELNSKGDELVVQRIGLDDLFARVAFDGQVLGTFGALLRNQPKHSLALDGFMKRSGQRIVFTGKWLGGLAAFADEELLFLVEPAWMPNKPMIMQSDGSVWLRHGPLPASLDITSDEERFYILTRRSVELGIRSVVDVYESSNGSYQRSLLLPPGDKWRSLALSKDHFYVAGLRAVARWPASVTRGTDNQISASTGRPIVQVRLARSSKQ